ncbi:MAG: DUF3995 domain-containing protein [Chloroflexi bacterium]|nr:DUF3995 domain-containing protein [Chloroflexota bacterium]
MSIRVRTETLSGTIAASTLAVAAAVHVGWATGSTWPAASPDELADLVVGRRPMPGPVACATAALALTGAAVTTAMASTARRPDARSRAGATMVSAALLARGIGGAVAEIGHLGQTTPEFRRSNRRLYNPLCVVLGILVAASRRSRT